jgi:hypothetical protein
MVIFTCYYTWHLGLAIVSRIYRLHHCGGFDSAYVHVNINDQSHDRNDENCMFKD